MRAFMPWYFYFVFTPFQVLLLANLASWVKVYHFWLNKPTMFVVSQGSYLVVIPLVSIGWWPSRHLNNCKLTILRSFLVGLLSVRHMCSHFLLVLKDPWRILASLFGKQSLLDVVCRSRTDASVSVCTCFKCILAYRCDSLPTQNWPLSR